MKIRNSMAEVTMRELGIGTPPDIVTVSVPADLNANKLRVAAAVIAGVPIAPGLQGKTRACLQNTDQFAVLSHKSQHRRHHQINQT